MLSFDGINIIGVRHLSPAAARCVVQTLNNHQPSVVLIEGPSDATPLIDKILHPGVQLPVSLLAYTKNSERTLAYPLAEYSPEYQAMKWAKDNNRPVRFIDLPAETFLALDESKYTASSSRPVQRVDIYHELADRAGESSYDSYWERNFEHLQCATSFLEMTFELGLTLRKLEETSNDFHHLENLTREAYMRRCIAEEIEQGIPADKITVILGAYHAPVINSSEHIMTDKELKALPVDPCAITLMPYSYFRLSRQSGYGAGNSAPLYFASLLGTPHGSLSSSSAKKHLGAPLSDAAEAPYTEVYIASIADYLRQKGKKISPALLIDAAQLCRSLALIKSGVVVLEDLRSAVETCFMGEIDSQLKTAAYNFVEIGSQVGSLPEGLIMTSIQDDFNRQLKKHFLTKYKNDHVSELKLDLRENRTVKTKEAAFRDLGRSNLFNQINFLKIPFAKRHEDYDKTASWKESWFVRWQPESEIALVDNVLWGETIKAAVHARFNYEIQQCNKLVMMCRLVRQSLSFGYEKLVSLGVTCLQNMSVSGTDFIDLGDAIKEISLLIQFGSIRKLQVKDFTPLLDQMLLEAGHLLFDAADCNFDRQGENGKAIVSIHKEYQSHKNLTNTSYWIAGLQKLAHANDRNPFLSGLAYVLLIDSKLVGDQQISTEITCRLSPGMAVDISLSWFEGLISHNPLDLLHRNILWQSMSDYIYTLDDDEFKKSLVQLRRTFSEFSDEQKRLIAKNLIKIWGLDKQEAEQLMNIELTEEESAMIDELDDLDFDF